MARRAASMWNDAVAFGGTPRPLDRDETRDLEILLRMLDSEARDHRPVRDVVRREMSTLHPHASVRDLDRMCLCEVGFSTAHMWTVAVFLWTHYVSIKNDATMLPLCGSQEEVFDPGRHVETFCRHLRLSCPVWR